MELLIHYASTRLRIFVNVSNDNSKSNILYSEQSMYFSKIVFNTIGNSKICIIQKGNRSIICSQTGRRIGSCDRIILTLNFSLNIFIQQLQIFRQYLDIDVAIVYSTTVFCLATCRACLTGTIEILQNSVEDVYDMNRPGTAS